MSDQPEALRLADLIDSDFDPDWMHEQGYDQIAAELRRLHSENERLREAARVALEALESLQGGCTDSDDGTIEAITVYCPQVIDALRAALGDKE